MSNEAAERLLASARDLRWADQSGAASFIRDALDAALAAERRATVERIRAALLLHEGEAIPEDYATAILDAEAAR